MDEASKNALNRLVGGVIGDILINVGNRIGGPTQET